MGPLHPGQGKGSHYQESHSLRSGWLVLLQQAVPALQGRCAILIFLADLLPSACGVLPNQWPCWSCYTHSCHRDGRSACSVRVGSQSAAFGHDEEGWVDKEYTKENTAKIAMNALYLEGVPMNIRAIPDAIPFGNDSHAEPQFPTSTKLPCIRSGRRVGESLLSKRAHWSSSTACGRAQPSEVKAEK